MTISIGFVDLIWVTGRFVDGRVTLAGRLEISKLVIGWTTVAFGTSTPEVVVLVSSSLKAAVDLAVGNAIGSNIFNLLLVG
jgi:cation:H+ antiporter